ncbi:unnamed protein product [Cylindrotheca closterium]|uniref:Uncharacterized protein n=1 Tax=Cylindrotheca closterium TaxID=2856 RepID=A0AAD2G2A0_9STRA|nr:unnamed protein product [Cylindrotheca closterium]
MTKKSKEELVQDLKEIESKVKKLIIVLDKERSDKSGTNEQEQEKKFPITLEIGDKVLIKKPKKGQETIGRIESFGRKFVTVKTATQTIKRIPQNLKKVGN